MATLDGTKKPETCCDRKTRGGDGVLIQSDAAQYMGSITTGNAFTAVNGSFYGNGFNGSALTTGTFVSAPMIRRGYFAIWSKRTKSNARFELDRVQQKDVDPIPSNLRLFRPGPHMRSLRER
jgi:hypothetical protein